MPPLPIVIAAARFPADRATVRRLFSDYIKSLNVDLTFQDVDAELNDLPGKYAPPGGHVLLARDPAGSAIGCVALRPGVGADICEMKRLYVDPRARGHNLGRRLAEEMIAFARAAGYRRMLLDTLAPMRTAQKLYAELGFRSIAPYYHNPLPDTVYMALEL